MTSTTWEDELPVKQLPDDPTWRENFCFDGYDRQRDIGFWIHCGRWSLDPRIWREQVLLYLPDGTYLVHRSWGFRESDKGPSGALLDLICKKPGEEWQLKYHGPARRAVDAELHGGALTEGPQMLLDLDIAFTTKVPMWDMTGGMKGQAWGKFHIEQTGRFQGTIKYEDTVVKMDGLGWHDHSRGARDMKEMGRHCWIHGNLSKDRSFCLTFIDNVKDGAYVRALEKAVIWDGGKIYDAKCPNPPFLQSNDKPPPHYEMTFEYEKGVVRINAEPLRCLPHSTSRYMECFDGKTPGIAHIVTYEQGTVFTVDGQQFDGHTERSFRL
jgi:hypothetical protein